MLAAPVVGLPTPSLAICLPLVPGHEAAIKPDDSAARLFSEEGSSLDLRLFSLIAGRSLCLGDMGLTCCCCGRAGGERAGLEGLV